tara:strand:+ start:3157 stop:4269 length:1113 start_codon:yes stop_codon:yes gene_type:complete
MKINFIDLKKQYLKNKEAIDSALNKVLEDTNFILGNQVSEFEKISGEYVGSKCIGVANGTDALFIALKAIGIGEGDEVITPSFTWVSTVETIKMTGAKPLYVDIKSNDFNLNEDEISTLITSKTKAIMSVSIFGRCPHLKKLKTICEEHGLFLIEDAAQSYGAKSNGSLSCSVADISTTSFFPAKPLGCYGDGGAIYSNNENFFEEASLIARHGQSGRYNYLRVGVNSRLDTIQAAVLIEKHKIFEEEIKKRNSIAKYYEENLIESNLITTPKVPNEDNRSVWAQYTILLDNDIKEKREFIMEYLKSAGIPSALYYPVLLHKTNIYKDKCTLPVSEDVSDRVLSLPMHPYLEKDEVEEISYLLKKAISEA